MPTYEYECKACGYHFEELQRITDEPLKRCPRCSKSALRRLFGGGLGIIFKGSGFYTTDYRKSSSIGGNGSGKSSAGSSEPKSGESKGSESKGSDSRSSEKSGSEA